MIVFKWQLLTVAVICRTAGSYLNGHIYADNWFQLYYNGKLVTTDPVSFTPHNAVFFNITEEEEPECRTFAIFAKDYADDLTGLEYDNTCVGDGGLRAVFSDGVVTNSNWKYFTIFYGPDNLAECLPGVDLEDGQRNCAKEGMSQITPCQCMTEDTPEGWNSLDFDDSLWAAASEYTDKRVGWGKPPKQEDGLINPRDVDWGVSSFIWGPDLDLHNRVLFRYSTCSLANTEVATTMSWISSISSWLSSIFCQAQL